MLLGKQGTPSSRWYHLNLTFVFGSLHLDACMRSMGSSCEGTTSVKKKYSTIQEYWSHLDGKIKRICSKHIGHLFNCPTSSFAVFSDVFRGPWSYCFTFSFSYFAKFLQTSGSMTYPSWGATDSFQEMLHHSNPNSRDVIFFCLFTWKEVTYFPTNQWFPIIVIFFLGGGRWAGKETEWDEYAL